MDLSIGLCNKLQLAYALVSASPLNGQAAELWDKDRAEYNRQVLLRHEEPIVEEADAE